VQLLVGNRLMDRRVREALLLDFGGSGASAVVVDRVLCLGGVSLGVALDSLRGVSGVLGTEVLDLCRLLVGNVVALLKLGVNDLLVLDVDERTQVGNNGGDERQAPQRDELDEEVGDERSKESLAMC
jgi:hypothetical protein